MSEQADIKRSRKIPVLARRQNQPRHREDVQQLHQTPPRTNRPGSPRRGRNQAELEDKVTTSPVCSVFKKYLTYLNQTWGDGKQKSMELDWVKNQLDQFKISGSRNLNKSEVLDEYLTTAEIQTLLDYHQANRPRIVQIRPRVRPVPHPSLVDVRDRCQGVRDDW